MNNHSNHRYPSYNKHQPRPQNSKLLESVIGEYYLKKESRKFKNGNFIINVRQIVRSGQTFEETPWEVDPSIIEKNFEMCWRKMCEDLKFSKYFLTTGGTKRFRVWSKNYRLFYEKSTGNICQLSKSDFKKAYEVFRKTGSLSSTKYRFAMHGSYIPPLL